MASSGEPLGKVLGRLEQGKVPPIVVTRFDSETGEDLFGRDRMVRALERATLGSVPDVFGRTIFDGPSVTLVDVIDAAREVSLLAPKRLVLVRGSRLAPGGESGANDADETAPDGSAAPTGSGRAERGGDDAQLSVLARYLADAARGACVAFIGSPWDARRKIHKAVLEAATVVDTSRPDLREIPAWIEDRVRERGARIDPDARGGMCELVGNDTLRLSAEIDKLLIHAGEARVITSEDVRTLVGGAESASAWGLVDAIADGDAAQAIGALRRLLGAGEPAPMLVGAIASRLRQMIVMSDEAVARRPNEAARRIVFPGRSIYFAETLGRKASRFSPRALMDALAALYDVDRACKSTSVDAGALLETWLIATLKTGHFVRS